MRVRWLAVGVLGMAGCLGPVGGPRPVPRAVAQPAAPGMAGADAPGSPGAPPPGASKTPPRPPGVVPAPEGPPEPPAPDVELDPLALAAECLGKGDEAAAGTGGRRTWPGPRPATTPPPGRSPRTRPGGCRRNDGVGGRGFRRV